MLRNGYGSHMKSTHNPITLVIRPSGIWDSRAPLATFIQYHRKLIQTYNLLTLALGKIRVELTEPLHEDIKPAYFRLKKGGERAKDAWNSLKNTYGSKSPTGEEIARETSRAFRSAVEYVLIRYVAMFETHINCWALNVLLARLERRQMWSSAETKLAERMSTLGSGKLPQFREVIDACPILQGCLSKVSVFQPGTSETIKHIEANENFNSWKAINLFREIRHLLVHRSGTVYGRFLDGHRQFLTNLREVYPTFPQLQVGSFVFTDDVFRVMTKCHVQAAYQMNRVLFDLSSRKRGDLLSQTSQYRPAISLNLPVPGPMLMRGDHPQSYQWSIDPSFRAIVRDRNKPSQSRSRSSR